MTEQVFPQDGDDYTPPLPNKTLDDLALEGEDLPEVDEDDMPKADEEDED